MINETEFDAGRYMDRQYYPVLGHFYGKAAIEYDNCDQDSLYKSLHNLYGMIPSKLTKPYKEEIEKLFIGIKEHTTKTAIYDLWRIRQLITDAMFDGSMLFNRWPKKIKKDVVG